MRTDDRLAVKSGMLTGFGLEATGCDHPGKCREGDGMAIKTILLMAQTLDGKIAKHADHYPDWTGRADKQLFIRETRRAGAIIMGSRTFDTIGKPLPGRRNIIMTRNPERVSQWDNLVFTSLSPQSILEGLERDGFERVVLAGGARINTLFAEAGLIDEILVTITPLLFGRGIAMFEENIVADLSLVRVIQLDPERVCLHYRLLQSTGVT
jgi:dihydrofolate reductase